MSDHAAIAIAMDHCRALTKARARNFYYGLKLLPEPKRSALYAIYAWMREADDIIDGESGIARPETLERFASTTRAVLDGAAPPDDPMWIAFGQTARDFTLDAQPFIDMIEGQVSDLEERPIRTRDDLFEYCRQVASTVGLVCIEVWGYDDPAAPALAVDRGIAFQLTNILRDIHEDVQRGRCYLPSDQLAESGLPPGDLVRWLHADRCESIVRGWIDTARDHYERSAPLDAMISADCRPTLWAMTTIYSDLLDRIARDPRRSATGHRVRLSKLHKATIALRARRMAGKAVRQ